MIDSRLNSNPLVDEAHHRVAPYGGPQKYTGKSMAESHKDLKITSKEWESFLDDFQQTLDKFAVPTKEQAELKTIVNSTRSDIVVDSGFLPGVRSQQTSTRVTPQC
jgi:hemoglobin